jgi:hypothetical protein
MVWRHPWSQTLGIYRVSRDDDFEHTGISTIEPIRPAVVGGLSQVQDKTSQLEHLSGWGATGSEKWLKAEMWCVFVPSSTFGYAIVLPVP